MFFVWFISFVVLLAENLLNKHRNKTRQYGMTDLFVLGYGNQKGGG